MPEIIPIKDLRNITKIPEICHKTKELVFIIKKMDMVI